MGMIHRRDRRERREKIINRKSKMAYLVHESMLILLWFLYGLLSYRLRQFSSVRGLIVPNVHYLKPE
jgi:hypothetical protein